ncbi:hypothetical protein [Arundinibacter roseus]|uniref:Uncharacterized protein n=1 Tax=Arundinibacter roseus TaxID=2070510 RepID=A0A4R4KEJ5_9BACT|nr:hypothetical protein [Arundinibacter roseus]TDB65272.1 hypothetical protein EZE20_11245 [Arundinibacter roseus]
MYNYKKLTYQLDRGSGWYKLQFAPVTASTLPDELKVEERLMPGIKADIIVHGRERIAKEIDPKRPWKWFTGLRPTNRIGYHSGHFRTSTRYKGIFKRHFCLFKFSPNSDQLTLYFFEGLERPFGDVESIIKYL